MLCEYIINLNQCKLFSFLSFFIDHPFAISLVYRLHSVLLLIVSGLFGIFVVAIMVDQIHAILYDETAIEQAQGKGGSGYRPNRRKFYLLADVFGRGHPLCWLLPCSNITASPSLLRYHDTPLLSHEV